MLQYYAFYKPFQVLTQFSPEDGKQTLANYLSHLPKDIYPAGRLDYDSEGLLILTNDKTLTNKLLNPQQEHRKTYWVQVEGIITMQAINELKKGVTININGKAYKTKPAVAEPMTTEPEVPERNPPIRFRKNIPVSWLSLTITEGKNRQVRKMTAAVGFPTLRLIRHSIGNINTGSLLPGEGRYITKQELKQLFVKMS